MYMYMQHTHTHVGTPTHFKTFHLKTLTSISVTMEMAVIKAQEYLPDNNVQYKLKVKLYTEKMVIFTGL